MLELPEGFIASAPCLLIIAQRAPRSLRLYQFWTYRVRGIISAFLSQRRSVMAQQTMHAQMGGETSGSEELIQAGAVTFGLEYRTLHEGAEEGVCIHVYGD